MYVEDQVIVFIPLIMGLFFTAEWLHFPIKASVGPQVSAGVLSAYVRIVIFPFLAGAAWFVEAALMASLNNCVGSFATCWTSPTWATTTATVTVEPFAGTLYYLFYALFWAFMVIGLVSAFYFAFKPIMPEFPGEKAPV